MKKTFRNGHRRQTAANDKRLQESSARIAEQGKELANIEKLFLSGIVTPENAAYWNSKLSEIRHALEQSLLLIPNPPAPLTQSPLANIRR